MKLKLAIYTRYLVEEIQTGAADLDGDGAVSVNELHNYVKAKVEKAAENLGLAWVMAGFLLSPHSHSQQALNLDRKVRKSQGHDRSGCECNLRSILSI